MKGGRAAAAGVLIAASLLVIGVVVGLDVGGSNDGASTTTAGTRRVPPGNEEVDVAVFLAESASPRAVSDFQEYMMIEVPPRPGMAMRPGVSYMGGDFRNAAVLMDFEPGASASEVRSVLRWIDRHPGVVGVREDWSPSSGRPDDL